MTKRKRGQEGGRGPSKRAEAQGRLERLLAHLPPPPPEEALSAFRALGVAAEGVLLERVARAAPGGEERAKLLALARLVAGKRLREGLRRMAEEGEFSLGELFALQEGGALAHPVSGEEMDRAEGLVRELETPSPSGEAVGRFLSLPRLLQSALVRELSPSSPPPADVGPKLLALASALAERKALPPPVLVEVLSRWEVKEAAEALVKFLEVAGEGEDERAIAERTLRKALYQLESRGVAAPRRAEAEMPPPPPARPALEFARAFASTLDGRGQQLLWLARSRPGGGRYLFQALLREGEGIAEFFARGMSTREVRELLGRFKAEGPYPIVEVPPAYACWLLARAREENERSGTPLPASCTEAEDLLSPLADPEGYPPSPHPVRKLLPDAGALDLGEDWAKFLARPEFASWLHPRERAEEFAHRLADVAGSRIVLTEEQRGARLREVVREASETFFADPALRARYRARLEGMAYLHHRMGKAADARMALKAANGLAPEARVPPPFFEVLTHRSLLACLRTEREEAAPKEEAAGRAGPGAPPSPIIRPGEPGGRIIVP